MATTRPSSAAGVGGEDRAAPDRGAEPAAYHPTDRRPDHVSHRSRDRGRDRDETGPGTARLTPRTKGREPDDVIPARASAGASRPAGRHGLLWGALFTLIPYLIGVLAMLGWTWAQDQLGHDEILIAVTAAPYAALGTGLSWLLVLAMQYAPTRRWRGATQGLVAASTVYAIAAIIAFGWYL